MPEPATRSFTVEETRTSPGPATAAIRAPMCTAIPPLVAYLLAFACVETSADIEAQRAHRLRDRPGTHDRAGRPIEACQETVAGVVDLATAKAVELLTHQRVVGLK